MLLESTRIRIKKRKTLKHSNLAQFLKRIEKECNEATEDLTLVANNFEEKYLEEIFTAEKLAPLILAILEPQNKRTMNIAEMLAGRVFQKLASELPPQYSDAIFA